MKRGSTPIKSGSTLFLKFVLLLIGCGALAWLVYFPQTEGRAKDLDLLSIYLDPVIGFMYLASTPFFAGLYQAFKLLGLIQKNNVFSDAAVGHLRNIKYCVLAFIAFIIIAEGLLIFGGSDEDKAGPMALGIYVTFASIVVAAGTAVAQKLLQNAVDIKSENDLTV